ncbi:hypothetical protein TNCV_2003111 [Trichonephila clavipes]|nr:hypothetical protein TNCV_2003111 [Trichonephila clavipes]
MGIGPWLALSRQLQINDEFCGMDVNTPLGGSMAVEAAPVLRFSGILLTAVAATSTHDYTVTFLGTSTGHLKKWLEHRTPDRKVWVRRPMPPNTLRVHAEYVLVKSVGPKAVWVESRVQGTGEYFHPHQFHA